MRHAFFAEMGGFLLQTADEPSQTLNADALFALIQTKCLSYPDCPESVINDKNKHDGLARYEFCLEVGNCH